MSNTVYTFNTKFAKNQDRNGEKCIIIKIFHNGKLQIKFLKDNKTLTIYDTEIE